MSVLKDFFEIRKTEKKWHMAVLAGLCVGIPVLGGYFTGNVATGKLASLAGFVIFYMSNQNIARQMITLMACSFGFMVAFTLGIIFSFDEYVGAIMLGVFAAVVHLAVYYLRMPRPPGNFFFIMIASVAVCMPFDLSTIPQKVGIIGIGTMISCTLGLIYSLITLPKVAPANETLPVFSSKYVNIVESLTFGIFVGGSLLIGRLMNLNNPYWIPASCVAVMQGVSAKHIWTRSLQRIAGTFIGLLVAWGLLLLRPTTLVMCAAVIVLQIVIQILVSRNYGIAVIFVTVLTIFLAESGSSLRTNPNTLMIARFVDIVLGSAFGAIGGWVLYNQKLQFIATRQLRKTKVIISRLK
jgi:uncharacterized membrane protein YccC